MASIFDSFDPPTVYADLGPVPLVLTVVTPNVLRSATIFLSNVGATDGTVTITNTAGVEYVKDMFIPANTPAPLLQFPLMRITGLKWIATGTINGQVEGFPNV